MTDVDGLLKEHAGTSRDYWGGYTMALFNLSDEQWDSVSVEIQDVLIVFAQQHGWKCV
jgi:hypothetical protein